MLRSEKAKVVEDVKARFDEMSSAVFVDYKGMTVEQVSDLREQFRAKGVQYRVVKNTLVKLALKDEPFAGELGSVLTGMTGIAWSYEEPSAAARIAKAYAKDNEKLTIKAGLMDGQVLDAKAVENQLATLPSKDEARATLLATFMAPAQQMVMVLNAPPSNFVRLLNAKKEQG